MAKRVCGHALLESGALGDATDDESEDRRLQPFPSKPQLTGAPTLG